MLVERSERMLSIETAGTTDFEYVQAFYRNSGYDEESRICDFYTDGVDKIVVCKRLNHLNPQSA